MAAITWRGFCAEAALSRKTSGLPCTCLRQDREVGADALDVEVRPGQDVHAALPFPPVLDRAFQQGARALVLDRVHRLGQERADQDRARRLLRDAAAAQVEQLVGVQLADRGAVAAFHVVGINLELRLAVDLGVAAEQQRLVHLIAVGLLRDPRDLDPALEHAAGAVGQHVLDRLARSATGRVVRDHGGDVAMLLAAEELRAVQVHRGVGAEQAGVDLGASEPAPERQHEGVVHPALGDLGEACLNVKRVGGFLLQPDMDQLGTIADHDLGDRVVQIDALAARHLDHRQAGAGLEVDAVARMERDRAMVVEPDREQHDGTGIHTLGHVQTQPVIGQHRVERHHGQPHVGQAAELGTFGEGLDRDVGGRRR